MFPRRVVDPKPVGSPCDRVIHIDGNGGPRGPEDVLGDVKDIGVVRRTGGGEGGRPGAGVARIAAGRQGGGVGGGAGGSGCGRPGGGVGGRLGDGGSGRVGGGQGGGGT